MLRRWISQAGGAALLATLAACGGGGSSGPADAVTGTGSSGITTAAPATSSVTTGSIVPATTTSTTTTSAPAATTAPAPAPAPAPAAAPAPATAAAANNVLPIVVDTGTDGTAFNAPFVSVTVCQPGTALCQTIDHVLLDTGSYGLRIAASALSPNMALPVVNAPSGAPLGECASFVSGYAWGSVRTADVKLAGEQASGVSIQVVNDTGSAYANVPTACGNTGAALGVGPGSKGILGIGFATQDCGAACVSSTAPAVYFACPASGCVSTTVPLAAQVSNPVARFASDNNGVAITFPAVATGGASSLAGSLVFGVGTQSNNQVGSRAVYTANSSGNFTTTYKGQAQTAFIDSGSNALFFRDTSFGTCGGFYCPTSPQSLSATITGANSVSGSTGFLVEGITGLPQDSAAAHLAGDLGMARTFDWGLPFFFGRTVFVAMQGASTPQGSGPYWAF